MAKVLLLLIQLLPPGGLTPLTLTEAQARYGKIDMTTKVWENEVLWMVSYPIKELFPSITMTYRGAVVTSIRINRDLVIPLTGAFSCIVANKLQSELVTFDGVFNVRTIRGGATLSTHAYGLAIDINASRFPLNTHGRQHPQLVKCFTDQGFSYGANFNRPDPHHFSYGWE